MAAPTHAAGSTSNNSALSQDTLITIKVTVNDAPKKLKLPLRDLTATVLPGKLRQVLDIKPEQHLVLERWSDSASGYITLDASNTPVFKTLIRAAKAKLKLRLKATVTPNLAQVKSEEQAQQQQVKVESHPVDPVIVHSPAPTHLFKHPPPGMDSLLQQSNFRDSTALDQRSVGSGIFQFREARASQQTLVADEAPVPKPFSDAKSAAPGPGVGLAFRSRAPAEAQSTISYAWSVYCNSCDKSTMDVHFHCSICDGGDYDLCEECVNSGKLCPGEGHWLIKRFLEDGKVINSTTERISPRTVKPVAVPIVPELPAKPAMPGAFTPETKTLAEAGPTRTCNNCVVILPEAQFVTCVVCDDFDLCVKCHVADKHGHHPAHGFKPATDATILSLDAESKLAPGRNIRHNAVCDGCNKKIFGVRHKCLNCPDWDYCNDCIKGAPQTHPRHRFASLYQPIAEHYPSMVRHFGIYCDGPLCSPKPAQSYIQGIRYKCAICHDTDFCANCEALPSNHHNRTHPLIKLKTPVREMNVLTENEDGRGNVRVMGDRRPESPTKGANAVKSPAPPANATTEVQTVADIKPTEAKAVGTASTGAPVIVPAAQSPTLNAHFVRDTIIDGTVFQPNAVFVQVWTLKNPGPTAWPAGCSVRYVGGDNMLNVDNEHPSPFASITGAMESNVVGRDIQPGEEIAFKVTLKAPKRAGKSISYWRLKSADGAPFGHRLWCDIEVKQMEEPTKEPTTSLEERQNEMIRQQQALVEQRILRSSAAPSAPPLDNPLKPIVADPCLPVRWHGGNSHRMPRTFPKWDAPSDSAAFKQAENHTAEKARHEAIKQRVAQIKANIRKSREENEKLFAEQQTKQSQSPDEQLKIGEDKIKAAEDSFKASAEKLNEIVGGASNHGDESAKLEGSQMVFPKLEKESPASSTANLSSTKAKGAYVENEKGEVERSATLSTAPAEEVTSPVREEDFEDLDDIDVLSAAEDDSDDDGFLTDEEYDILDASDRETVA